jgi:hypothetical protein
MKKLILKIAAWFRKEQQPTTSDVILFDLERFQIKFCKNCGAPFEALTEKNYYCSRTCRIRFNNKKRRRV